MILHIDVMIDACIKSIILAAMSSQALHYHHGWQFVMKDLARKRLKVGLNDNVVADLKKSLAVTYCMYFIIPQEGNPPFGQD